MSSDDDYSSEGGIPKEESPHADSGKSQVVIQHPGKPSPAHSTFSQPKEGIFPENLWTSGDKIYDFYNPDKNLPPAEDPNDLVLRFDSKFESGNLLSAFYLNNNMYHLILEPDKNGVGATQWFYFQIKNSRKDIKYTFFISGFHKKVSLYTSGCKIFWYSERQFQLRGLSWTRGGNKYAYQVTNTVDKKKKSTLQFTMRFPYDSDIVYLSGGIPFTYSDLRKKIEGWRREFGKKIIIETLCKTFQGRDCPIITLQAERDTDNPVVLVTARIHPGETNSSYVLNGLIDFLKGSSSDAEYLLSHFKFKIIPMLNIDGVVEGLYRTSMTNYDLNRMWSNPDKVLHPVIFNAKNMMMEQKNIVLYLDLHGHSRLHGTFAYGCPTDDLTEKYFPRILSYLCDAFSWAHCVFSFPKERKSASRIVLRNELNIVQSFTIETSFGGIGSGSRAGLLYDEIIWNELGEKIGESLFHLLSESPLYQFVVQDIAFMNPSPAPLTHNEQPSNEPPEGYRLDDPIHLKLRKKGEYHFSQPNFYFNLGPDAVKTDPYLVAYPRWEKLEFDYIKT